jgi:hypothetical protein
LDASGGGVATTVCFFAGVAFSKVFAAIVVRGAVGSSNFTSAFSPLIN